MQIVQIGKAQHISVRTFHYSYFADFDIEKVELTDVIKKPRKLMDILNSEKSLQPDSDEFKALEHVDRKHHVNKFSSDIAYRYGRKNR